jgi:FTR1 family protein
MARYTHSFCVLVLVAVGIACVAGEVQREAVGEHRRAGTAPVVVRSDDLSVPALVITFRECVEGCVIVSVLLNMLHKAGMHESKKWVWIGTTIALLLTVFFGSICIIVWYTIQRNMPNDGRAAFEGALATVACSVLSLMGFKFLRLKDIIVKWEGKLFKKGEAAPEGEGEGEGVEKPKMSLWQQFRDMLHIKHQAIGDQAEVSGRAIILLTISAIFREGLETVIFLLPMSTNSSEIGLVKGAFAGGAAGFAFGLLVLVVGKYALTNVMWFFNLTTAFIFFIAGGLANYALIEFEQIDTPSIKSRNDPWLLRPVYNIGCQPRHPEVPVRCFLDETTGAGLAFRSLLGTYVSSYCYICVLIILDMLCFLDETAGAGLAFRSLLGILLDMCHGATTRLQRCSSVWRTSFNF